MEAILDKLTEWGAFYGTRILGAIAIVFFGRLIVRWIARAIRLMLEKSNTDETLIKFLSSMTRITLMVVVYLAALNTLGVETTSFVAIIGAAGLAIGFALQGSLSNLAAGVMLIIFRPFKVGDYVEAGGTAGTVEAVHIFHVILKTPDNKKVIVPNSKITGDSITNYSAQATRRVDMEFGIGYDDDIKKAKQILERLIAADERILKDPAPTVAVKELGDSSVNFAVRPWVNTADYWAVYFDFTEQVKLAFDAEGVSIPFPQTDVHLFQQNA